MPDCVCGKAVRLVPGNADLRWLDAGENLPWGVVVEMEQGWSGPETFWWEEHHRFEKPVIVTSRQPMKFGGRGWAVPIGRCGHASLHTKRAKTKGERE